MQVVDERSQPMPFAYITINSRAVAVTDTLGYAKVNVSEYSHNDTIKVSYIATSGAGILIGEVLDKGGRHTFTLHEELFELNTITISPNRKSARNKFFRETNITMWLFYDCTLKGDFAFDYYRSAGDGHVAGQFTTSKINDKNSVSPMFNGSIDVLTSSDPTGIDNVIRTIVSLSNSVIGMIHSKRQRIVPFYTYLGEFDGIRQYRIVYTEGYNGHYYQIIAHIDSKTRDLIAFDCDIMNETQHDFNTINISCEVERFTHKKPKLPAVLVPRSIRYNVILQDGSRIEIKIYNMVYEYLRPKRNR